jgi:hypothetical protein
VDAGPDADGGLDLDAASPYCVSCTGNRASQSPGSGICTATEALIVAIDIAQGAVTDAGPDPVGSDAGIFASCYACLNYNDCLDTNHNSGVECDDTATFTAGTFTAGNGAATTNVAACLATLSCVTGTQGAGCALSTDGQTYCMCGAAEEPATPSCQTSIGSANGVCLTPELNGFTYAPTDGIDLVEQYTNVTEPSGQANNLVACALINECYSTAQAAALKGDSGSATVAPSLASLGAYSCFLGTGGAGGK